MLSISAPKSAGAGAAYYLNYYLRDSDGISFWYGMGAHIFGTRGEVTQKPFINLLRGYDVSGKYKEVKNAGDPKRQAFWDLTFSVPKSVSVAYWAAPENVRKEMDSAIIAALCKTLDLSQDKFILGRRGKAGCEWVPAWLTFACFRHITSRENQPQIHWHCVLINLALHRLDSRVSTLVTELLFPAKLALGAFFLNELEIELTHRLGFQTEKQTIGFSLSGVPKEVCEANSKRRQQITEYLERRGLNGGKAAKEAALQTRAAKKPFDQTQLFANWREQAAKAGWGEEQVEKLLGATFFKGKESNLINEPKKSEIATLLTNDTKELGSYSCKCGFTMTTEEVVAMEARRQQVRESLKLVHSGFLLKVRNDVDWKDFPASHDSKHHNESYRKPDQKKPATNKVLQLRKHKIDPTVLASFKAELRNATDKVFPGNQSREKIERMAFAIGRKYAITATNIKEAVDNLQLPIHKRFYRIEWHPLFPNAPSWNKVAQVRLPRIVLEHRPHKWGEIYYSKPIPVFGGPKKEFRIQERMLFPKAPGWNPLARLSVKAIRFGPYREYVHKEKEEAKKSPDKYSAMNHEIEM